MMNREACVKAANEMCIVYLGDICMAKSATGNNPAHIRWMTIEMEKESMSDDKANRWLGYIQGWMVANDYATLEDCKIVNAKYSKKAAEPVVMVADYEKMLMVEATYGIDYVKIAQEVIAENQSIVKNTADHGRLVARLLARFIGRVHGKCDIRVARLVIENELKEEIV